MQHQDSRGRPLKPCRGCGGPKPPGKGHGYCDSCKAARTKGCRQCGAPKRPGPGAKLCEACRQAAMERRRDLNRVSARRWTQQHPDRNAERAKAWREANPDRARALIVAWELRNPETVEVSRRRGKTKRRLREREAFIEDVHPLVVLELADGVCGICGTDVDPYRFDVDHIVPLSKDGEHSYANTQPAHPSCNRAKGAKVP